MKPRNLIRICVSFAIIFSLIPSLVFVTSNIHTPRAIPPNTGNEIPNIIPITSQTDTFIHNLLIEPSLIEVISLESESDSSYPDMAIDQKGNLYVVWVDTINYNGAGLDEDIFLKIWNKSTETWSAMELISVGSYENSSFPDVVIDTQQNIHVAWQEKSDRSIMGIFYSRILYKFWNASKMSWSPIELVDEGWVLYPKLSLDKTNMIHITYIDIIIDWMWSSSSILYARRHPETGWSNPINCGSSNLNKEGPEIAIDKTNIVYLIWGDGTYLEYLNFSTTFPLDLIQSLRSKRLSTFNGYQYDTSNIEFDSLGHLQVAWRGITSMSGYDDDIFYSSMDLMTRNWTPMEIITPESSVSSKNPTITIDSNGHLHAIWIEYPTSNGDPPKICYSQRDNINGTWSFPYTISTLAIIFDYPPQIIADESGMLHILWADRTDQCNSGPDSDIFYTYLKREPDLQAPNLSIITPNPDPYGFIQLNWSAVEGATHYYIYRDSTFISSIENLMPIATVTQNFYQDSLFQNGNCSYAIVVSNNFSNSSLSNCESVEIRKYHPIFEGMHLIYQTETHIGVTGYYHYDIISSQTSYTYSYISDTFFHITIGLSGNSYDVDVETGVMSNCDYNEFSNNRHTPFWIFRNVTIGDIVLKGPFYDWEYQVTGETLYNYLGLGQIEIIQLKGPEESFAWYEKNTGLLIKGCFWLYWSEFGGNQYYYYELLESNVAFIIKNYYPLLSDSLCNPESGDENTLFNFKVVYTDKDNNAPIYIDLLINGTSYPMEKHNYSDFTYDDGCSYQFSIFLPPGIYEYLFNCSDGSCPILSNGPFYLIVNEVVIPKKDFLSGAILNYEFDSADYYDIIYPNDYHPLTLNYTQYAGTIFNVTAKEWQASWNVDWSNRTISNSDTYLLPDGIHTPFFITPNSFQEVPIGFSHYICSNNEYLYNLKGETQYNIPGYGNVSVWVMEPANGQHMSGLSYAWYEKTTGLLVKGKFYVGETDWGIIYHKINLLNTNIIFERVNESLVELVSSESTAGSIYPCIAVDTKENIHIIWSDNTDYDGSGTDYDLFYKYLNSDTGLWNQTKVITMECTDSSIKPEIAIDKFDNLHIVWMDKTNYSSAGTDYDVFYRQLNIVSGILSPIQIISTESSGPSYDPVIAVDNFGNVHIAWYEQTDFLESGSDYDIYYRRFDSITKTWAPIELISTESTAESHHPIIITDLFGNVHLAWRDVSNYMGAGTDTDLFYKFYDIQNRLWSVTEVISTESTEYIYSSGDIAVDRWGNVLVVWEDDTVYEDSGTDRDIAFKSRNKTTESWSPIEVISKESSQSTNNPQIGLDSNGNIYVSWEERTSYGGYLLLYKFWNASTNFWSQTEEILPIYHINGHELAVCDGSIHFVWSDAINIEISGLDEDIFYKRILTPFIKIEYDPPAPEISPPNLLSITPNPDPDGFIQLNWNSIEGATHYYIFRDSIPILYLNNLNAITSIVQNSYQDPLFKNGNWSYGIVASNGLVNSSLSNCEHVEVKKNHPLFEGMYLTYKQSDDYGLNQQIVVNYSSYMSNYFQVRNNEGQIMYTVNIQNKQISNSIDYYFENGCHTPFWISNNISQYDIIKIGINSDYDYWITGSRTYNLPGVGDLEVWVLNCGMGYFWYEKTTGIMVKGKFHLMELGFGCYWIYFDLVDTNLNLNSIQSDTIPPPQVTGVSITVIPTGNALNLTWDASPAKDLAEYVIYRDLSPGFSPGSSNLQQRITNTHFIDTDLTNGVTYYYRIIAVDEVMNYGLPSDEANGIPQHIDTIKPIIATISFPLVGSYVKWLIQIQATAEDNPGGSGIKNVTFWLDGIATGTFLGTDSTFPYALNWDSTTTTDGTHELSIQAFDYTGNSQTSPSVPININNSYHSNTSVFLPKWDIPTDLIFGVNTASSKNCTILFNFRNTGNTTLVNLTFTINLPSGWGANVNSLKINRVDPQTQATILFEVTIPESLANFEQDVSIDFEATVLETGNNYNDTIAVEISGNDGSRLILWIIFTIGSVTSFSLAGIYEVHKHKQNKSEESVQRLLARVRNHPTSSRGIQSLSSSVPEAPSLSNPLSYPLLEETTPPNEASSPLNCTTRPLDFITLFKVFWQLSKSFPIIDTFLPNADRLSFITDLKTLPEHEILDYIFTLLLKVPLNELRVQVKSLINQLRNLHQYWGYRYFLKEINKLIHLAETLNDHMFLAQIFQTLVLFKYTSENHVNQSVQTPTEDLTQLAASNSSDSTHFPTTPPLEQNPSRSFSNPNGESPNRENLSIIAVDQLENKDNEWVHIDIPEKIEYQCIIQKSVELVPDRNILNYIEHLTIDEISSELFTILDALKEKEQSSYKIFVFNRIKHFLDLAVSLRDRTLLNDLYQFIILI